MAIHRQHFMQIHCRFVRSKLLFRIGRHRMAVVDGRFGDGRVSASNGGRCRQFRIVFDHQRTQKRIAYSRHWRQSRRRSLHQLKLIILKKVFNLTPSSKI